VITEVSGSRITVPALTALDLALDLGGEAIDRALRMRQSSLDDMAEALRMTPGRAGNVERRRWLLESRDEPWSEAEREGHRLLRAAGITGWEGNVATLCGDWLYYLDIGFRALKLGIEIDGREIHSAENVRQFHHDRQKWTTLTLHGWMLLHFAANHLFDEPGWFVDCVQSGVTLRRRQLA
jgi:very-short-patch-repair endonuclease